MADSGKSRTIAGNLSQVHRNSSESAVLALQHDGNPSKQYSSCTVRDRTAPLALPSFGLPAVLCPHAYGYHLPYESPIVWPRSVI